ncbi:hypothetical protein BDV93DRAFT_514954 [Ceratobasidium sp. AG-I]|nr:hypothetical protein BDV93DRAFT_514954 [Ceratobasidium sp. AG-I]
MAECHLNSTSLDGCIFNIGCTPTNNYMLEDSIIRFKPRHNTLFPELVKSLSPAIQLGNTTSLWKINAQMVPLVLFESGRHRILSPGSKLSFGRFDKHIKCSLGKFTFNFVKCVRHHTTGTLFAPKTINMGCFDPSNIHIFQHKLIDWIKKPLNIHLILKLVQGGTLSSAIHHAGKLGQGLTVGQG